MTISFGAYAEMDRLLSNSTTSSSIERCDACSVRHRAVCGALSSQELLYLNQMARHKKISAGQIILSDQEPADFVGIITSGAVKLTKTLADGRQQVVGLQFASDFLGRTHNDRNHFFAEAATDVEICSFSRDDFEALLKKYPELETRLFKHTLNELDSAREWMLLLGRKTAEEKVASFLLMLAQKNSLMGCPHSGAMEFATFTLPITRTDMGDYLGLTIETVSRQITRLKTSKVISITGNREFLVPDLNRLAQIAGHENR